MKILLVCSGGMSTSILINALTAQASKLEMKDFTVNAVGVEDVSDNVDGYDILLLAPQIRHKFNGLKEITDAKGIKIYQIQPTEYAPTSAATLIQSVIKVLK